MSPRAHFYNKGQLPTGNSPANLQKESQMNEVFEQEARALLDVGRRLGDSFEQAVELMAGCQGKLIVAGIGKSGIVAHKIAATLASTGSPAVFLNAGEALHGDLGMVTSDDVVIMLSKSANTPELLVMLPSIRNIGAKLIGLFGRLDSPLATACDVLLDVSVEEEACPLHLAPTTSCTVSMVAGDALAIALMRRRNFSPDEFAVYHPGGELGRRLLYKVKDVMHSGDALPRVSPEHSLREAVEELARKALGAVCIADESGNLLGIITEGDVRRLYLQGRDSMSPVREAMSTDPMHIAEEDPLGKALDRMEKGERKVYVLPVLNREGQLSGLLRMHDIVAK